MLFLHFYMFWYVVLVFQFILWTEMFHIFEFCRVEPVFKLLSLHFHLILLCARLWNLMDNPCDSKEFHCPSLFSWRKPNQIPSSASKHGQARQDTAWPWGSFCVVWNIPVTIDFYCLGQFSTVLLLLTLYWKWKIYVDSKLYVQYCFYTGIREMLDTELN